MVRIYENIELAARNSFGVPARAKRLIEFDETEAQLDATEDIKADMQKAVPMDRLLCGDVGFGKTEVAFRAIFKCVTNGRQAFMLAPTTLLVQQHYENFLERIESNRKMSNHR